MWVTSNMNNSKFPNRNRFFNAKKNKSNSHQKKGLSSKSSFEKINFYKRLAPDLKIGNSY